MVANSKKKSRRNGEPVVAGRHSGEDSSPAVGIGGVSVAVIFCDDIRQEASGLVTIVGAHPRVVNIRGVASPENIEFQGKLMILAMFDEEWSGDVRIDIFNTNGESFSSHTERCHVDSLSQTMLIQSPRLKVAVEQWGDITARVNIERVGDFYGRMTFRLLQG